MWEGDTTNVKTGKYLIKDNLTPPKDVLKIDRHGRQGGHDQGHAARGQEHARVLRADREGVSAGMIETREAVPAHRDAKELEAVARDKEFLAQHAITGDTVEGYLFPDTYEFRVGEKPRAVLEKLIRATRRSGRSVLAKHPRDTAQAQGQAQAGPIATS